MGLDEPKVLAHSETESWSDGNGSASVSLLVPWAQRYGVFDNILTELLEWPYAPGCGMYASDGTITPYGSTTQALADGYGYQYEQAQLNINFKSGGDFGQPGGGEDPEALYAETIEPNGEMVKLNPRDRSDRQIFYWGRPGDVESLLNVSDEVTDEEAPTRLIIGFDYVVKWTRLPSIPVAVLDVVDHVNDDTVTSGSLGLTFPAETLLCNAPVISRTVTATGSGSFFSMDIRFSYRKNGWNRYWRAKSQDYVSMFSYDPDAMTQERYLNFPLTDLSDLLP